MVAPKSSNTALSLGVSTYPMDVKCVVQCTALDVGALGSFKPLRGRAGMPTWTNIEYNIAPRSMPTHAPSLQPTSAG